MFSDNENLKKHIREKNNGIDPKILKDSDYSNMFSSCLTITNPPKLPSFTTDDIINTKMNIIMEELSSLK